MAASFARFVPAKPRRTHGACVAADAVVTLHACNAPPPGRCVCSTIRREARKHEPHTIRYEVERGRARITLNRPEKLNALSMELLSELHEALWEADNDREVHAVILRGAGRSFSAGYDLTPPPQQQRAVGT